MPASHAAALPSEPALPISEVAARLRLSESQIYRHVDLGMPCMDAGISKPGRRRKRVLRFIWSDVVGWMGARARKAEGRSK